MTKRASSHHLKVMGFRPWVIYKGEFTPIEVSREMGVTNKTIINRLSVLVKNGFAEPLLVNQRIRSYELSDFTRDNEKKIKKMIS